MARLSRGPIRYHFYHAALVTRPETPVSRIAAQKRRAYKHFAFTRKTS